MDTESKGYQNPTSRTRMGTDLQGIVAYSKTVHGMTALRE